MESNSPRILGEGSFGCVLKPAVQCVGKEKNIRASNSAKQNTQIVGKVFADKTDYQTEVKASKKIAKVDPRGKHILVPTSYCSTSLGAVAMHPAANDCEVVQSMRFSVPSSTLYQLKMPYGGQRYDKYIKSNSVKLHDFVEHIIHVLEGVQKLQKHNTCHQDLKASNLLISASGQVMIIDYSLMAPYEDVYVKKNLSRLRHTYFPYPPEYKMFYLVYSHICNDKKCDALLPQIMKNFDHYGSDRMQIMLTLHKDVEEYVATFYKHMLRNKNSLPKLFLSYAKKMDVYSVGAIMMDLDKYIVKQGSRPQKVRAYYEAMAGMTMIDPRKRWTVSQALKKLKAIR